jgi:cytochrome c oxidase cbb3-type subunit 2
MWRVLGVVLLCFAAGPVLLTGCSDDPGQQVYERLRARGFSEEELRGEAVYRRYCIGCHGVEGDGQGEAAAFLDPRPRNFTLGAFKFRSTPSGSLPTDDDLMRTLRNGVHGTSMPEWRLVPEAELRAVIAYLKTFSTRFDRFTPRPPIALPGAPTDLAGKDRIERGKEIYFSLQCNKCHGDKGKGDGPSARTLVDSEGLPIVPFDFTRRSPKGGTRPEDYYRTFMTGLNGTPMPSYAESIPEEQDRWDLVAFTMSLREDGEGSP